MYKNKINSKSSVLLLILCLITNILITQAQNEILHLEQDGLLIIEAENTTMTADWQAVATNSGYTGAAYIVWTGEQYLDKTGKGVVRYPIRISTPGTYRLSNGKKITSPFRQVKFPSFSPSASGSLC
jgi:hypothetical protein